MRHKLIGIGLCAAAALSCSQWQRVGTETVPQPDVVVPGLFDLVTVYRRMGFLAQGPPVAFVATVRFLAGPTPDSTIGLLAISLPNNTLSFRRTPTHFEANYRVEAIVRSDTATTRVAADETVRVARFQETQRADESVIFQHTLYLRPGAAQLWITVRDVHTGGFSRDSSPIETPRYEANRSFSSVMPIYQGVARSSRAQPPDLLVNPRATIPFGSDTLQLYLEAYGADGGAEVAFRAVDEEENEVWRGSSTLGGGGGMASVIARAYPGALPIGQLRMEAIMGNGKDTVRAPLLVSFSEHWVVANFEEVLDLLRHFGHDEGVRAMRAAPAAERPDLWRAFWRDTDPNPSTPENEALDAYFGRVQQANVKFREGSEPGWLTDRGEVFINLGEPDEVFDQSSDLQGQRRAIRWTYSAERLTLDFVDDSGFGRFRLTPASRAEYQRVLNRVRRQ